MTTTLGNALVVATSKTKAKITVYCQQCDNRYTKRGVLISSLLELQSPNRRLVQDIFPDWTRADRELFLMTHTCKKCYDKLLVWDYDEED